MGFLDRLRGRGKEEAPAEAAERAQAVDEADDERRPKTADQLEEDVAQARDEDAIQRPRFH